MSSPQRKFRSIESDFRELLARQHALVTTAQAHSIGIASPALNRRLRAGELERVLPHVYRSTLVAPTLAQSALAAVFWAGPDAIVSHTTAASLWGLAGIPSDKVHLLVPPARRPRAARVVVHRGEIAHRDRRMRDGVPVTSPARTLVDLAGVLGGETLEASLEDALHRGLTTSFALLRCLDAIGGKGRTGSQHLRRLLDGRDDAALESRLEVKVWRLLRGAGLRPVRQYEVRCGERTYRLDFAWPKFKVAVEADGFSAHGGTRIKFVADRRRAADLAAATWTVIPVTWDECTGNPGGVIQRVGASLLHAA